MEEELEEQEEEIWVKKFSSALSLKISRLLIISMMNLDFMVLVQETTHMKKKMERI